MSCDLIIFLLCLVLLDKDRLCHFWNGQFLQNPLLYRVIQQDTYGAKTSNQQAMLCM